MSQWGEVQAAAELVYADRLQRLAFDYSRDPQQMAQDELAEWDHYDQTGTHFFSGGTTMEGHEYAHSPVFTGNWAHESLRGGAPLLRQRSQEYRKALEGMASEGPLGVNENGLEHHEALEEAHNNMRIELQHHNRFTVPTVDELSSVNHPTEANAWGSTVNPRYDIGLAGKSEAAQRAYKVNCQRCVLAADARHRGHNVEARPSYQTPEAKFSDKKLDDHDIASLWQHPDGSAPRWQDAEDLSPHSDLTSEPEPEPNHWDVMHDHIAKNWPPGARGIVAPSYHVPGGDFNRHVVNVEVHPYTGKVRYSDPQSAQMDVHDKWRNADLIHTETSNISQRKRRREFNHLEGTGYFDTATATRNINKNGWSGLRFMRTDNLDLHPNASQFMVDRGTAPHMPIIPPKPIT